MVNFDWSHDIAHNAPGWSNCLVCVGSPIICTINVVNFVSPGVFKSTVLCPSSQIKTLNKICKQKRVNPSEIL